MSTTTTTKSMSATAKPFQPSDKIVTFDGVQFERVGKGAKNQLMATVSAPKLVLHRQIGFVKLTVDHEGLPQEAPVEIHEGQVFLNDELIGDFVRFSFKGQFFPSTPEEMANLCTKCLSADNQNFKFENNALCSTCHKSSVPTCRAKGCEARAPKGPLCYEHFREKQAKAPTVLFLPAETDLERLGGSTLRDLCKKKKVPFGKCATTYTVRGKEQRCPDQPKYNFRCESCYLREGAARKGIPVNTAGRPVGVEVRVRAN